jgi:hypothetical protein
VNPKLWSANQKFLMMAWADSRGRRPKFNHAKQQCLSYMIMYVTLLITGTPRGNSPPSGLGISRITITKHCFEVARRSGFETIELLATPCQKSRSQALSLDKRDARNLVGTAE